MRDMYHTKTRTKKYTKCQCKDGKWLITVFKYVLENALCKDTGSQALR